MTADPRIHVSLPHLRGLEGAARGLSFLPKQASTSVLNGRFKGGWTTRRYGRPAENLHVIQMELAQSAYLSAEAPPWNFDAGKCGVLRPILGRVLRSLADLAPTLGGNR